MIHDKCVLFHRLSGSNNVAPDLDLEAPAAKRKNLPVSYFSWICILYNYTVSVSRCII